MDRNLSHNDCNLAETFDSNASFSAPMTDLSIIIINWKSVRYLSKCLEGFYKDQKDLTFEIIVIDNASYDGCQEMLAQYYPQVKFIQSPVNLGFARANNFAFRQSRGRTLLFLNPDTEIIGQSIQIMHHFLWEIANAGAIGCMLLNTDHTIQASCIQEFPTILNQTVDSEIARRFFPSLSIWGTRPFRDQIESPICVQVVSGACLMVKRNVFESVGQFSDDYFMYSEDTDLCFKINTAGFKIYYTGAASAVHHGGGSSKQRDSKHFADVVMVESIFRFLQKFRGKLYGYIYRFAMACVALLRVGLISSLIAPMPKCSAREKLKVSLGKWVKIFRWSLGLEKWASSLNHETVSR